MRNKTFSLLPLLLAACAADAPSTGSLPEGRYQLSWTCLNTDYTNASDPQLVQQHQLVVANSQLAFDAVTIQVETFDGPCATTAVTGDIPAFTLCADDSRTMSGSIAWGDRSWAFTATPVTAPR